MSTLQGFSRRACHLVFAVACMAVPVHAQHALVLSGGGARGLAHAGAVGALERLGYDPHVVVGTSMGAIIGALYAAGYTPEQIDRVISGEDWLARFAAEPEVFGAARQQRRPLLSLGLGPRRQRDGVLPATRVNLRLVELLFDAGVRAGNDFDRLPRRFRAVTADLGTGEQVVLPRGDLPRIVRASMAVPGVFPPVVVDGRVLVDGGIANNLPVSVARELTDGPVIAIDVVRPDPGIPERDPVSIGIRAVRLLILNAQPDAAAPDILVLPDIPHGFAESRFPADPGRLIRAGRDAVLEQVPAVSAVVSRPHVPVLPDPSIERISVTGADPASARLIMRIMDPIAGAYDGASITRRVAALYATGLFHAVWPRIERAAGRPGASDLVIDVTPAPATAMAGAVRWDSDVGAGAWLSVRQRLSLMTPWELRLSGAADELGRRLSGDLSIFSTKLPGLVWTAGAHGTDEHVRDITRGVVADTANVTRAGGWGGAELRGTPGGVFASLTVLAEHVADGHTSGTAWGPQLRVSRAGAPARVTGVEPLLELELRTGGIRYARGHLQHGTTFDTGRTLISAFGDLAATDAGAPADVLPAATRELAPWLRVGARRAAVRAVAAVDVAHPFVLDGYLRGRLRAYGSGSGLDALRRDSGWAIGAEAGAVWPTVIGPVAAGVAFGRGARWRFNLSVGPDF